MSRTPPRWAHELPSVAAVESNPLGLAGFIVSLIGFLAGGILCPIGFILSLFALGRRPRGFAIAGAIIGFLGSCGGLIVFMIFGSAILAMLGIATAGAAIAGANGAGGPVALPSHRDAVLAEMARAREAIRAREPAGPAGSPLPLHLAQVEVVQPGGRRVPFISLTDPWGESYAYVYSIGADAFDLASSGPDRKLGTADDIRLDPASPVWTEDDRVTITQNVTTTFDVDLNGRGPSGDAEREQGPDGSGGAPSEPGGAAGR